jgi:hypothetical protein
MTSKARKPSASLSDAGGNVDGTSAAPSTRLCPICGKPATEKMRPFCSKRCADVDLHRWLGGVYAIPAAEIDDASQADVQSDEDSL